MNSNSSTPLNTQQYQQLANKLQLLTADKTSLEEENAKLKRENGQLITKLEEMTALEKTVKQLSKKVLEFSKYRMQKEKLHNTTSPPSQSQQQLQKVLQEVRGSLKQKEIELERKCRELTTMTENKGKVQLVSAEIIANLKRRITQLDSDNKTLEERYKKLKEENNELASENERVQSKYERIMEQFNDLYEQSNI